MHAQWVTFDCFGTLVDWHAGFTAILRPIAGAQTEALLRAYHVAERRVEAERPFQPYRTVLISALRLAATEVGLALTKTTADSLPDQWSSLPVFNDVEPMLTSLRKAGCKLGVLTNCDEDLFSQTHRLFKQPFDLVITAERVRDYKPAHSHFQCFERTTGVPRANWVHVACSWFHDIVPARELGLQHIWLDRELNGEQFAPTTTRIISATELPGIVRRLFAWEV